ncbi:MAG: poly(3-hydroxybutyrate) depolymerase [Janthinobacterium sp.]|jgi:poly(3-hydroxybutyrate) depolymerase
MSVSALSSGAYMAKQFQVAYSSIVAGVGIIAGGPFY